MNNKTEQFVEKAKKVHGIKYDYSMVEYEKANEKVIIICRTHGEFQQTPSKHLAGGCKRCAMESLAIKRTSSSSKFIEKAKKVHGNKYDYSKVEYVRAIEKVNITCKTHGDFLQTPNKHLAGDGCSKCSGRYRYTTAEFIEKARGAHGDKYDYSNVEYVTTHTKVIITCKEHGKFEQQPSNHLIGRGCPICAKMTIGDNKRSNKFEFLTRAKIVHGDAYDYSKVEYFKCNEKVTIICKIHGEFEQTPGSHSSGNGCPLCGRDRTHTKQTSNTFEFITKAKNVHGDKYDYSKVDYVKAIQKVCITCKEHRDFHQTPDSHLAGRGCPKCSCKGFSKAQIEWLELLEKLRGVKIQHMGNSAQEHRIKSTKWKADGYCKETNTVFEYHGDYWHGNPNIYDPEFMNKVCNRKMKTLYANTMKREKKIKDLGYNLEVMWESDWNKITKGVQIIQRKLRLSRRA